jgi:hypothetical protein
MRRRMWFFHRPATATSPRVARIGSEPVSVQPSDNAESASQRPLEIVVAAAVDASRQSLSAPGRAVNIRETHHGRVAELADAQDLKSCDPLGSYGFEPRPGYLAVFHSLA